MTALQFYETTVLITANEQSAWLSYLSSPADPGESFADVASKLPSDSLTNRYQGLIAEASWQLPVLPHQLDDALEILIRTAGRSTRSAKATFRYWLGPPAAREPLERAREARERARNGRAQDEAGAYDYGIPSHSPWAEPTRELARQATTLNIVPIEASAIAKRALTEVVTGATVAVCFFAGGPVLLIIGSVGLVAVRTVGSAAWEGVRPEVVDFSGDASAEFFDFLRAKLGIRSRRK